MTLAFLLPNLLRGIHYSPGRITDTNNAGEYVIQVTAQHTHFHSLTVQELTTNINSGSGFERRYLQPDHGVFSMKELKSSSA